MNFSNGKALYTLFGVVTLLALVPVDPGSSALANLGKRAGWIVNGDKISTTGSVGIGTNNPTQRLDVLSPGGAALRFRSETQDAAIFLDTISGTTSNIRFLENGVQQYVISNFNQKFHLSPEKNGDHFVMNQDGNVGIGDGYPDATLSVAGNLTMPINGTVTIPSGSSTLVGVGTDFINDLSPGDAIEIEGEINTVASIQNATTLTLSEPRSAPFAAKATAFKGNDIAAFYSADGSQSIRIDKNAKLYLNDLAGCSFLAVSDEGEVYCNEPNFDSGWFEMRSQAGNDSFRRVFHNFGDYPRRVKVLIRAIDGPNQGFIFEGQGMAQSDDDIEPTGYGGVVFAYNHQEVKLWAPDRNNQSNYGRIIFIEDGWGGENDAYSSHVAEVKVLAWR
jgi:hypothetical protein